MKFDLPEPIIQHILSFLAGKEAAQTTILSKSLYSAWLTRPNLDLNEADFPRRFVEFENDEFWDMARKTIQRYEQSNLKIQSFSLCLRIPYSLFDRCRLANELIVRALRIGATHLNVRLHTCRSLLPPVVFGSENLVQFSAEYCQIVVSVVRCSRLESLSLKRVRIRSDVISNIVSSCPLIEKLSLIDFERGLGGPINLFHELHKLKCLVLCEVIIDTLFLGELSSKFPSLKELTLQLLKYRTEGDEEAKEIRISSRSLEFLNFATWNTWSRFEFEVPNIVKFTFEAYGIPRVSFKPTTSRKWESSVTIRFFNPLSTSWFLDLNKLLIELGQSRIYLVLDVVSEYRSDFKVERFKGLHKPEVESLTMDTQGLPSLIRYVLSSGLFHVCRPKLITHPESMQGGGSPVRPNTNRKRKLNKE